MPNHLVSAKHTADATTNEAIAGAARSRQFDPPRTKLIAAEVALLRTMHEVDGRGYRQLARTFGVSKTTVAQICRNERRVGAT